MCQKRVQAAIREACAYIDEDEEILVPHDLEARMRRFPAAPREVWRMLGAMKPTLDDAHTPQVTTGPNPTPSLLTVSSPPRSYAVVPESVESCPATSPIAVHQHNDKDLGLSGAARFYLPLGD
jgi:hypothetical protein